MPIVRKNYSNRLYKAHRGGSNLYPMLSTVLAVVDLIGAHTLEKILESIKTINGHKAIELPVKPTDDSLKLPEESYKGDAGHDLIMTETVTLEPGQTLCMPTNASIALPNLTFGLITSRSSTAKAGVLVHIGIVDSGYRGIIKVTATNLNEEPITIHRGDAIAQLIVLPFIPFVWKEVESLAPSDRGVRGFGSSGRNIKTI
jgi:dUTP pyrophosphatase